MNRCVWSHIYSCQNNIWYMREYFCWLSETIGAAIKSCFSEAPQHYEWENHTYGKEYLAVSCPYLLPTIYACCHLLQTHKELKWSDALKSGHRHAKDMWIVFIDFSEWNVLLERSEMLTMYSTYSMYEGFKLLNPVTSRKA